MKRLAIAAILAASLVGCAVTPEQMSQESNWNVCRLSMDSQNGKVADQEAQRRGLDCAPYYSALQQQQAAMGAMGLMLMQQNHPVYPVSPMVNCTTIGQGAFLNTQCH